ncbi:hypothetical protein CPC698_1330, partial [Chlamydia psittaci C6/98]
MCSVNSSHR